MIGAVYPAAAPALEPHPQESNELIAMITASLITAKANPHREQTGGDGNGKWKIEDGRESGS